MARKAPGLALTELLIAVSILGTVLIITHLIFLRSKQLWSRLSGDQSAGAQLQKAESWLRRDLSLAAYDALRVAPGPSSLVGRDGDAIWFLSAIDPLTGQFVRHDDGTPRWQRNILYYSVIPNGLEVDFQGSGVDSGGYEASYPYKVLVRKQIDFHAPTLASDPTAVEELIPDITPYLERPSGLTFSSNDAEAVTLVANHLLGFQAVPDPGLRSVNLVLQAAALEEARAEFPIGSRSLLDPRFLLERRMEMFPGNQFTP